ncbi:MAG TPA: segregation/condensation protein A [Acidobacteriota bacterium]|nr:segregation/condensation protein A [Acidobacteriota bacterium]
MDDRDEMPPALIDHGENLPEAGGTAPSGPAIGEEPHASAGEAPEPATVEGGEHPAAERTPDPGDISAAGTPAADTGITMGPVAGDGVDDPAEAREPFQPDGAVNGGQPDFTGAEPSISAEDAVAPAVMENAASAAEASEPAEPGILADSSPAADPDAAAPPAVSDSEASATPVGDAVPPAVTDDGEGRGETDGADQPAAAGAASRAEAGPSVQPTIIDRGESHEVRLADFEGPLDLLLHLIRKEQVDIYDIPIALITTRYLEYIELMQDLNINLAGEFLEMAATLIYIKSRMLLPPEPGPEGDEAVVEDPRQELVERLLEYEQFKNAAQVLYTREQIETGVMTADRIREVVPPEEELLSVSLFDLIAAYKNVLRQLDERAILEMERENVTVAEKIAQVREMLEQKKKLRFTDLVRLSPARTHVVVLMLALLELARMRDVRLRQDGLFSEIWIIRKAAAHEPS